MSKPRVRTQALGDRSNAIAEQLAADFGLKRAAVERIALDRLAQDEDFRERMRAWRAAETWLRDLSGRFGARSRLQLTGGKPALIRSRGEAQILDGTFVATRPLGDGRRALDVQIATDEGEVLVIEAVRIAPDAEAVLPLAAINLAPPIPPASGEVTQKGPTGEERTVWRKDGKRETFIGDAQVPTREASFAA